MSLWGFFSENDLDLMDNLRKCEEVNCYEDLCTCAFEETWYEADAYFGLDVGGITPPASTAATAGLQPLHPACYLDVNMGKFEYVLAPTATQSEWQPAVSQSTTMERKEGAEAIDSPLPPHTSYFALPPEWQLPIPKSMRPMKWEEGAEAIDSPLPLPTKIFAPYNNVIKKTTK